MISKYDVVTLCGSTKFKDDFIQAQEDLTLCGYIVISVGLFGHADGRYQTDITPEVKEMLDDMHKKKIDMADAIYVINRNDYIGESTRTEIAYAEQKGKRIEYMFPHMEHKFNIGDRVRVVSNSERLPRKSYINQSGTVQGFRGRDCWVQFDGGERDLIYEVDLSFAKRL